MLQNAYFLAKIGADTAENELNSTKILPKIGKYPTGPKTTALYARAERGFRKSGASLAPPEEERRPRRKKRQSERRRQAVPLADDDDDDEETAAITAAAACEGDGAASDPGEVPRQAVGEPEERRPRRKKWRSDKRRQGVPLEDDDEKEELDEAKPTPRAAGQTAMPRVPSMPRLNTSARLQTSLRLPSRTRGKHRRLRELLDAETGRSSNRE